MSFLWSLLFQSLSWLDSSQDKFSSLLVHKNDYVLSCHILVSFQSQSLWRTRQASVQHFIYICLHPFIIVFVSLCNCGRLWILPGVVGPVQVLIPQWCHHTGLLLVYFVEEITVWGDHCNCVCVGKHDFFFVVLSLSLSFSLQHNSHKYQCN